MSWSFFMTTLSKSSILSLSDFSSLALSWCLPLLICRARYFYIRVAQFLDSTQIFSRSPFTICWFLLMSSISWGCSLSFEKFFIESSSQFQSCMMMLSRSGSTDSPSNSALGTLKGRLLGTYPYFSSFSLILLSIALTYAWMKSSNLMLRSRHSTFFLYSMTRINWHTMLSRMASSRVMPLNILSIVSDYSRIPLTILLSSSTDFSQSYSLLDFWPFRTNTSQPSFTSLLIQNFIFSPKAVKNFFTSSVFEFQDTIDFSNVLRELITPVCPLMAPSSSAKDSLACTMLAVTSVFASMFLRFESSPVSIFFSADPCLSLSITVVQSLIHRPMQQTEVDYNVLTLLSPPRSHPATSYDIATQLQGKFYQQCMQFLKSERKLYQCSKKIENKLASSLVDSTALDDRIRGRADQLDKIRRELGKINAQYREAQSREEFLGEICRCVNMEEIRKMLQLPKIDEDQFIGKIKQVDQLSQQISSLNSDLKIIVQIKQELSSILRDATNKLIKGNLSQPLLRKLITQHSDLFLRDTSISSVFLSSLASNRLNFLRVGLNPYINNINYVQNVAELYEKIVAEWVRMLADEMSVFMGVGARPEVRGIVREVVGGLVAEVVPKMERGVYKVKSITDISRIRASLVRLKAKLDEIGEHTWQPLPKVIMRTLILLEERLAEGAQQLQIAKYNIYSLSSYVPIREHLDLIKQAKSYDIVGSQIEWEKGFSKLSESRDPSKQPNNKSLIIFNLNIWYLYTHIMKNEGSLQDKAEKMLKFGIESFVNINLQPLRKQFESKSLLVLIEFSADIAKTKKQLQSEINLLGHEKLRNIVEKDLLSKFITEIYQPLLEFNNLREGLAGQKLLELCKKEKINLNKYGKQAEAIEILTAPRLQQLL